MQMREGMAVVGAAILAWVGCGAARAQSALPRITAVTPSGGQRGTTVELTVAGINIGLATGLLFEGSGLQVESLTPEKPPPPAPDAKLGDSPKNRAGKVTARVRIASDAEPGVRSLRVLTPLGPSDLGRFVIGQWPEIAEQEPNNSQSQAQLLTLPVTISGLINPAEEVDVFRFHLSAGRTIVCDVLAGRVDSPLDPILSLQDASGREVALNDDTNGVDSLLTYTAPQEGDYFLFLRDVRNQGSVNHSYRLTIAEMPYVTAVFPMGGAPGTTLQVEMNGVNLGSTRTSPVTLPADVAPGLLPLSLMLPSGASNPVTIAVGGGIPEILETEPNDDPAKAQTLPVPGTVNGRIFASGRSTASDADCYRFHAEKGQKLILEVMAHRAGSHLDSLLTVTDAAGKEVAVNDDGVGTGKDSRLDFTTPETGDYVARITDLQERQGPDLTYRFTITPAEPEFRLSFTPDRLAVGSGSRSALTVTAQRINDFDGEITLSIEGLPQGVSIVGPSRIRAGQKETTLVLTAATGAPIQATSPRVFGTATINGKAVRRQAQAAEEINRNGERITRVATLPTAAVTEPPDLVVTAPPEEISVAPGKTAALTVKIERLNGFKGKVSLSVIGLPEGISATSPDVPEDKTEGTVTFKLDEKTLPGPAEIVVAARAAGGGNAGFPSQVTAPLVVKPAPAEPKPATSDKKN